ncbi:MAG: hypothetical protein OES14_00790 [Nitrosopumilus sp.]|nr:hypothetical protein [Nitrosopumilus sp.]MDH3824312.1 hypothetical protein [Nitrosopumilus sp.]
MTSRTYALEKKFQTMLSDKEKEAQIAEYFLKSFEEKSPLDYDILDSMFYELKQETGQNIKNNT